MDLYLLIILGFLISSIITLSVSTYEYGQNNQNQGISQGITISVIAIVICLLALYYRQCPQPSIDPNNF